MATAKSALLPAVILCEAGDAARGPPSGEVRYARLPGQPYMPENIDGLLQDFINEFARLAHADADRVKHLLRIAPGLIGARATWDELGIEAAAHMGLVALARYLPDHGAPVSTCTSRIGAGAGLRVRRPLVRHGWRITALVGRALEIQGQGLGRAYRCRADCMDLNWNIKLNENGAPF